MKSLLLLIGAAPLALATPVSAQSMQNMPGMNMPAAQPAAKKKPVAKPASQPRQAGSQQAGLPARRQLASQLASQPAGQPGRIFNIKDTLGGPLGQDTLRSLAVNLFDFNARPVQ